MTSFFTLLFQISVTLNPFCCFIALCLIKTVLKRFKLLNIMCMRLKS